MNALKNNSSLREVILLKGFVYLDGSDIDKKNKAIRYFEGCTDTALDVANIAVVKFHKFLPALMEKMRIHLYIGDWDQCIDTADRCLTVDSQCIEALFYLYLYTACYRGDYTEANDLSEKLIESMSESERFSHYLYNRFAILISKTCSRNNALLQHATTLVRRAVDLAPKSFEYKISFGHILLIQGKPVEAGRLFRAALDCCPSCVDALKGLLECQLVQNKLDEVSTQLEFVRELQTTMGSSADVSYLTALLERKRAGDRRRIVNCLDDAVERHRIQRQSLPLGPDYFDALNADFVIQLVNEYLALLTNRHSPITIGTSFTPSSKRGCQVDLLVKCQRLLDPLTSSAPGHQQGLLLCAYVDFMLGNSKQALVRLEKCVSSDPTLVDAYILMTQIHLHADNLDLASQALDRGLAYNFDIRNHPLHDRVKARLELTATNIGSTERVIDLLKQAITGLSESGELQSIDWSSTLVEATTDRMALYLELIRAYKAASRENDALQLVNQAKKLFAASTVDLARLTIASAELMASNRLDETLESLAAIELDRDNPSLYLTARQCMADLVMRYRRDTRAYIKCYRELATTLDTTEAYVMLGKAYRTVNQPLMALSVYREQLGSDGKHHNQALLLSAAADCLVDVHQPGKAVAYYEAALEAETGEERDDVKGETDESGSRSLRQRLAKLLIQLGHFDKARKLLQENVIDPIKAKTGVLDAVDLESLVEAYLLLTKLPEVSKKTKVDNNVSPIDETGNKGQYLIDLIGEAKSCQMKLLNRLATRSVVASEATLDKQRSIMVEIYLLLSQAYIDQLLAHVRPRDLMTINDADKVTNQFDRSIDQSGGQQCQSINARQMAIDACQLGLNQVTDWKEVDKIDPTSNRLKKYIMFELRLTHQLAQIHLATGNWTNCEQQLRRLQYLQLLKVCLRIFNPSQSTDLEQQSNKSGHCPPANLLLGRMMQAKADFQSAVDHFEKVITIDPINYTALAGLIESSRRVNLDAIKRLDQFIEDARQLDRRRGDKSTGLAYCQGLLYASTGCVEQAVQCLNKARFDPEFGELAIYLLVELYLNPNGHTVWSASYGSCPTTSSGGDTVGTITSVTPDELANYESARRLFGDLPRKIRLPARHQFLSTMLQILVRLDAKQSGECIDPFASVVKNDPDSAWATYGLAQCYMLTSQPQKARNQLKRLAKAGWNFAEADYLERVWLLLADIYIQNEKFDISKTLLEKCLEYNKSCIKAYDFLGWIAECEQNYTEAVACYEKAWLCANKSNPTIGYKLAFNYLKTHKFTNAIEVCLKVLSIYPDYPRIRHEILDKAMYKIRT